MSPSPWEFPPAAGLPALIARAAGEARRVPAGAVVVLGTAVPAVPAERLLAAAVPGERALVAPAEWCALAGIGAAARVTADAGPARFARARDRARALFASVIRFDDEGTADAPAPRLVGGFSFAAEPGRAAPWEAFGPAELVLPRWTLLSPANGQGLAYLRLAVAPAELKGSERLLGELTAIEAALAAPAPANAPRDARVEEPELAPWEALVREALAAIEAGRVEKVVPARRFHAIAGAPFDAVAAAAGAGEPGTTRFLFERDGTAFVGRTPERLVRLAGGVVSCDALAGSIPRGADTAEDAARIAALLASDKDRREHALVVRGIVEDLAWLAELTTVPAEPVVRTLRTVHHLHTPIEGSARGTPHLFDLAAALHPTAAVAGRPRAAALEFLREREHLDRGWYAAPVGWTDGDGEGELWVALRSAAVRGAEAWAYAGAGVVSGSDPGAEWQETAAKAASILHALGVRP